MRVLVPSALSLPSWSIAAASLRQLPRHLSLVAPPATRCSTCLMAVGSTPELDGLVVLTLPVLVVPFFIFVAAALEPLISMVASARSSPRNRRGLETRTRQVISTLFRIGTPSVAAALLGFLYFDNLSLYLSSTLDSNTLRILASDNASGQFVQNFLIVAGTLFAILAGNAYKDLYEQQERLAGGDKVRKESATLPRERHAP